MNQELARYLLKFSTGQRAFILKLCKKSKETEEHMLLVDWLNGIPNLLFICNIPEAKRNWSAQLFWIVMGGRTGLPDFHIVEKRGEYSGLYVELKATGTKIYKKDKSLRKNDHLENQDRMHKLLRKRGYKATFAIGLKEAKEIITNYLKS